MTLGGFRHANPSATFECREIRVGTLVKHISPGTGRDWTLIVPPNLPDRLCQDNPMAGERGRGERRSGAFKLLRRDCAPGAGLVGARIYYYSESNGHVYELARIGRWVSSDLTAIMGAAPLLHTG
jgi:hypothetical protein